MKKSYEVKVDWVKSEKIDKVGLVTLNHENSLNPLSAGFVEAIYPVSYTHLTLPTIYSV